MKGKEFTLKKGKNWKQTTKDKTGSYESNGYDCEVIATFAEGTSVDKAIKWVETTLDNLIDTDPDWVKKGRNG